MELPSTLQWITRRAHGEQVVTAVVRNRFPGKNCVLCQYRPSEGVGEHVWSKWLIREFEGQGPFILEKGGVPCKARDGKALALPSLAGVHVPMCRSCNAIMDRTIEREAKNVVRRIVRSRPQDWPRLNSQEARSLARWLLKVGILAAHPEARNDYPQVDADARPRQEISRDGLDWLMQGDVPPSSFTVYVARRNIRDEADWTGATLRICLPSRVRVGRRELVFWSYSLCVVGLLVDLVWHPEWPIRHPLVESGRAAVLWPNESGIDLAMLPEIHSREFSFVGNFPKRAFADELAFDEARRTPLSAENSPSEIYQVPGLLRSLLPSAGRADRASS